MIVQGAHSNYRCKRTSAIEPGTLVWKEVQHKVALVLQVYSYCLRACKLSQSVLETKGIPPFKKNKGTTLLLSSYVAVVSKHGWNIHSYSPKGPPTG
jgi:hypothetical protein